MLRLALLFGACAVITVAQDYRGSRPKPVTFCYYSSFAQNREGAGKFLPEDIDPTLCSHLIFAFADIVKGSYLKPSSWNDLANGQDDGLYQRTVALKQDNPDLKVLLAVGGWRIGSEPFLPIVQSEEVRRSFVRNVVRFLRRHGFDGLDMDWEFPGTRGSGPEDKYAFTKLLEDLQTAFGREAQQSGRDKLLLTMAAAGGSYFINLAYETDKIAESLDYILLMAYNYHGSWNPYTGHHSGLFPRSDETGGEREWNQAWTIDFWVNEAGVPKEKVVVGIGTYGMGFTLADERQHGLKAAAKGGSKRGKYTGEEGIQAYYEICENLNNGWNSVWIEEQKVPYAYHKDQWIGYDNQDSVAIKARYIRDNGLGGAFIWSVEMDDFKGSCGEGKYPLLSTIVRTLEEEPRSPYGGSPREDRGRGRSRGYDQTERYRGRDRNVPESIASQERLLDIDSRSRKPPFQPRPLWDNRDNFREDDYDEGYFDDSYGDEEDRNQGRDSYTSRSRSSARDSVRDSGLDSDVDSYSRRSRFEDDVPIVDVQDLVSSPTVKTEAPRRSRDRYSQRESRDRYDDSEGAVRRRSGVTRDTESRSRDRYSQRESRDRYDEADVPVRRRGGVTRDAERPRQRSRRPSSGDYTRRGTSRRGDTQERDEYTPGPAGYRDQEAGTEVDTYRPPELPRAPREPRYRRRDFDDFRQTEAPLLPPSRDSGLRAPPRSQDSYYRPNTARGRSPPPFLPFSGSAREGLPGGGTLGDFEEEFDDDSQGNDLPATNSWQYYSPGTRCKEPGLFPHPGSCKSYFICVRHGDRWYKFHLTCPQGLGFKPKTAACGKVDNCE